MKTAIDWLVEELKSRSIDLNKWNSDLVEQAKEMEKQQIIDAVKSTDYIIGATNKESEEFAQKYYNETFKSN